MKRGWLRQSTPSLEGELKGVRGFGFEGEELAAVIFVLFAAGGDFGGQAIFEIAYQGFEAIEDGDDFFLDGERGQRNRIILYFPGIKVRLCTFRKCF